MKNTNERYWMVALASLALTGPMASVAAADGEITSAQKISYLDGGLGPVLVDNDRFGTAVDRIGDLDGDGVVDLVVGAEGFTGASDGAIWILFMNTDGTVRDRETITPNDLTSTVGNYLRFGQAVARLGDVNGDGTTDIAVGSTEYIWILFMNSDGTLRNDEAIDSSTIMNTFQSNLGESLAGLTDLDGDGIPDLAAGNPTADEGGQGRGGVAILFLNRDGSVRDSQVISDIDGGFLGTLDDYDEFGTAVARLGDLDGDGIVDLAVSSTGDDDGGTNTGAVWILFLNSDGTVASEQKISSLFGDFQDTLGSYDEFGQGLARIGDFDGSGTVDLAVSSNHVTGIVWFLFLRPSGTVRSMIRYDSSTPGFPAEQFGGLQGASLGAVGDLDGNGVLEVVLGDPWDDTGGNNRGAVQVVFLEGVHPATTSEFGCNVNPADTLVATKGPILGRTLRLEVHNTLGSQTAGATVPFLAFSINTVSTCSVLMPGWHMDPAVVNGEMVVLSPYATTVMTGAAWTGAPVPFDVVIPQDPSLLGITAWAQGVLIDTTPGAPQKYALTRALELRIGT